MKIIEVRGVLSAGLQPEYYRIGKNLTEIQENDKDFQVCRDVSPGSDLTC